MLLAQAASGGIPVSHAIVLGITQGLSEFLPISSSGHLILVPWLFGWEELTGAANADLNKTFDVALHVGTILASLVYFRNDLLRFAGAALTSIRTRSVTTTDQRMAWLLLLSAIPGAIVGAGLEDFINENLGQIWLIAVMLIVFGLVLLVADRLPGDKKEGDYGPRQALGMGLAQAAALSPGVSRSGITITAGRFLGFDRNAAARLSFLMSMPITGGAALYKGVELAVEGLPPGTAPAFFWGIVASAVTGLAAVWLVLTVVRTRSFLPFVVYRVAAGVAVLALLASPLR
ncbi:MAG TPA: undecaprenyl-diphosphate phosphatase [Acidimicrobiales bacterium]|nr:undecaprenyl-diphosphate phosphatase [Acidimicrobiales bacterium]